MVYQILTHVLLTPKAYKAAPNSSWISSKQPSNVMAMVMVYSAWHTLELS